MSVPGLHGSHAGVLRDCQANSSLDGFLRYRRRLGAFGFFAASAVSVSVRPLLAVTRR